MTDSEIEAMDGMGLIRLCRTALDLLEAEIQALEMDAGARGGMPSPAAAAGDAEEQDRQRREAERIELWSRDESARAAAYGEARERSLALSRKGHAAEIRDRLRGRGAERLSALPLEELGPFLDWLGGLEEAAHA